ncbi:MAG TPA: OmpW family outer membrane protein [Thermoanaerobaculia bacterium]|nr:OmpW family outer membrane protein [Thermoanaerobaculia bacterium]
MRHAVPITLSLLVLVLAVPMSAQSRGFDLTANAVWLDPSSEGTFDSDPDNAFDVSFDSTVGYGVAANVFFGDRISTEFAISRVSNDVNFDSGTFDDNATAEIMPITAVLQFHFAPNGVIDPYIGAGAAYVLIDDVDRPDELNNIDFERLDFNDDIGLALNAGLGIRLASNFGLNLDAKYVPLESSATAVGTIGNQEVKFDMSPVIFSAGLSLRF